jgi:hypothetical protein
MMKDGSRQKNPLIGRFQKSTDLLHVTDLSRAPKNGDFEVQGHAQQRNVYEGTAKNCIAHSR